jgi:tetratricopeptide (TPR) repeat protein
LLRGNLDEAAEIAGRAMARCADGSPHLAQPRLLSGLALTLSGRPEEGIALVTRAADLMDTLGSGNDAALAWRELAEALIQIGRSEQAIDALRKAADFAGARSATIRAGMQLPLSVAD